MIKMVQMVKLKRHTSANFIYKNQPVWLRKPLTINPANTALIPKDNPIHGIYANPAEWYKNPTKSPKKQATKPNKGPITIPVSMDKNKVKENWVSASLNSKNIFETTQKAVKTNVITDNRAFIVVFRALGKLKDATWKHQNGWRGIHQ